MPGDGIKRKAIEVPEELSRGADRVSVTGAPQDTQDTVTCPLEASGGPVPQRCGVGVVPPTLFCVRLSQ
jgi:hypothetical protein